MTGEWPPGWASTTLGAVVQPPRSKASPSSQPELPFVGMESIAPGSMELAATTKFGEMKSNGGIFHDGDVLYGRMRPYLNKVHRAKFTGACSAEFIVFPESEVIHPDFLAYLLHHKRFVNFASSLSSGDRPRVDFDDVSAYDFGLPPRPEQKRIVSKIDELFSRIDEGARALEQVWKLVERYRQSVLKSAVTGELTRDWREARKAAGEPVESGEALLTRILAARRESWELAELAKMNAKGIKPANDKWKQKYKEPLKPDTTDLPDLPAGWIWSSMEQLVYDGPTNGYSPKSDPHATGTKTLKLTATTSGVLRLDDGATKRIHEVIDSDSPYWLESGDLLIQRANSLDHVGVAAVFDGPGKSYIYPDLMMRVRICHEDLRRWVWRFLNAPMARHYFQKNATGTAGSMPKISGEIVRKLAIPLSGERELGLALSRLEQGLEATERQVAEIFEQHRKTSALRHAILRSAFCGKLLPQDSGDEPASILLERITSECVARKGGRKKKTT